jgi:exosortase/archaeosortase family protein
MDKIKKEITDILLRYIILIILGIGNLYVFTLIFTGLTLYSVYFFISLFFDVSLINNIIAFDSFSIEIISACIAPSAYYLLTILNLSTPKIKILERLKILFLSFLTFFVFNVFRIFLLVLLVEENINYFHTIHLTFYILISTLFVAVLWIFIARIFKIKQIPLYTDIRFLYKLIK